MNSLTKTVYGRIASCLFVVTIAALMVMSFCAFYVIAQRCMCLPNDDRLAIVIWYAFLVSFGSMILVILFTSLHYRRARKLRSS